MKVAISSYSKEYYFVRFTRGLSPITLYNIIRYLTPRPPPHREKSEFKNASRPIPTYFT